MPTLMSNAVILHVALGSVAVIAGAVALLARKGEGAHKGAGRLFAVAMALVSAIGAALGLAKPETHFITFHAGVLGVTLIASGWLAARAGSRRPGAATSVFGAANLVNAAALVVAGLRAQDLPGGELYGFAAEDYFFLSGMAIIAAIGDASLIFRKSLSARHRIARHLWRMCTGFFIAAGSAFTGPGARAFPEAVRESGILALPELLILIALIFWLARTLWRGPPAAARGAA